MKARLLIDCQGPNPDFKPPDSRQGPEAAMELRLYKARVPQSITIPAGTILNDPAAWEHCVMDGSGDGTKGIPGVILAEPVDDDCRTIVDDEISRYSPLQLKMYNIAKGRADIQSRNLADERKAAETAAEQPIEVTLE